MKKIFAIALLSTLTAMHTEAQNWLTAGNAAAGGNVLGTTNNVSLKLIVNNNTAGRIETGTGGVGANSNTCMGYQSFNALNGGHDNSALGYNALFANITGNYNTATGAFSLYNNTGSFNAAMGALSLYSNTTGSNNVASGYYSLTGNTTGSDDVAIGGSALYNNTTGFGNVAMGSYALYNNTTTSYNVAIGYSALTNQITGSQNVALGDYAYPTNAANNTNWMGLGYNTGGVWSTSNMVELGNSSVTDIRQQVASTIVSDERIKDNVKANVPGLEFINRLRPVTYNLNIHRQNEMNYANKPGADVDWEGKYDIEKMTMSGFIAQEVEKAAKESGYDFSGVDKPVQANGLYGLRYSDFVMPLVKSVQELSGANDMLKKQNDQLQAQFAQQQEQVSEMKAMLQDMQKSLSQCCADHEVTNATTTKNNTGAVLEQNFPNPFGERTVIQCTVPGTFKVAAIRIYDATGSEVMSFPVVQAGRSSYTINGGTLASGIYQYALVIDGNVIATRKMVLTQ